MTTNWKVLGAFVAFAAAVCLLAAFGGQLGMSHGALVWCQTIAALIGTFIASQMPAIFQKVEDAIAPPRPTQVPPSRGAS